jgi:hypothetical protein
MRAEVLKRAGYLDKVFVTGIPEAARRTISF